MFKDKKILLFSAKFLGYHTEIKNKLEELGAIVDLFDERPKNSFTYKSLIRINKKLVKKPIEKYYKEIIKNKKDVKYDFILFIKGEVITLNSLKELKLSQSKAKFILYMWDSIVHNESIKELFPVFDSIYSFDPIDSKEYFNIKFRPLFYLDSYAKIARINFKIKYNLIFIGSNHISKYPTLIKLREFCKTKKIKYFFFIYLQDIKLFYLWKIIYKEFRIAKKSDFEFKTISILESIDYIKNSFCLLDIEKSNQNGLTMRTLEALGAKKKLITTNKNIANYDFYNKNNILIIDRKNPIISKEFLTNKYIDLPIKTYNKYSIDQWLKDVFS